VKENVKPDNTQCSNAKDETNDELLELTEEQRTQVTTLKKDKMVGTCAIRHD